MDPVPLRELRSIRARRKRPVRHPVEGEALASGGEELAIHLYCARGRAPRDGQKLVLDTPPADMTLDRPRSMSTPCSLCSSRRCTLRDVKPSPDRHVRGNPFWRGRPTLSGGGVMRRRTLTYYLRPEAAIEARVPTRRSS